MASLADRASMASHLGTMFFGLFPGASNSTAPDSVRVPGARCSVGASLPRNSSPKKSRVRDRRPRSPVSRSDSANPAVSSPLFGDSSTPQLPPAQRLEVPRAAVSVCDVPASHDLEWGFLLDEESAVQGTKAFTLDSPGDSSSALGLAKWLSSDIDGPLSWHRSMLETHWLLDAREREQAHGFDEPEGVAEEGSMAEAEKGPGRQITGRTRRQRVRRKHCFVQEPEVQQDAEARQDPVVEDAEPVTVRSALSARARRRAARKRQQQETSLHAAAAVTLPTVNLQRTYLEQSKAKQDVARVEGEYALPASSPWKEKTTEDASSSHVWSFMKDIGYAKLLTKEEEVELANTFRAAEDLKLSRAKAEQQLRRELSHTEWAYHAGLSVPQLRQRLHAGDKARERLLAANMRLVVSVVKKYTKQGVQVSDLITAGTVGLAKGIDRFDPSRGFKLSTYVHWWIRQSVTRAAAEHMGAFRLPMHVHETLAKVKRVKADLAAEGQAPSTQNIANFLGVSEKRISKVQKLKLSAKSLDDLVPCPVGFSEGSSFHNFIHDPEEDIRSWTKIEAMLLKKDLESIMVSKLDARERDIICMHYGLKDKDGLGITLDNISLRYGVSRERIRQVETVAIRKLRSLCAGKDLQRYCY